MEIFISLVVFAAVAFAFFKWVLPFIKARNAQSDRTAIQKYGPSPYLPYQPKPNQPIPDNRPKPPEPPRKGDV